MDKLNEMGDEELMDGYEYWIDMLDQSNGIKERSDYRKEKIAYKEEIKHRLAERRLLIRLAEAMEIYTKIHDVGYTDSIYEAYEAWRKFKEG